MSVLFESRALQYTKFGGANMIDIGRLGVVTNDRYDRSINIF